uniref:Uncharacterized protein n=1 Tax=Quercus lobata TaxID=97700 RepID=A0A7N2M5E2_QUELO
MQYQLSYKALGDVLLFCNKLKFVMVPLLVINYDLPNNPELYIRRIGCSGPQGRKLIWALSKPTFQCLWVVAINLAKADEIKILQDLEQYYDTHIDEVPSNIDLI